METAQLEVKDQIIELSTEAFKLFCDDIADMFGLEIECLQANICQENPETLRKRFEKLVAVSSVEAKGALHGAFQIVFDQGGLFTLSGVIVMMSEEKTLEDIQRGSIEQAEQARENITEVATLLIGAWERVFQEELNGHGHFTHTNTFIGSLDNPEESIALPADEELVFVPYQITINPYPPFNCGVIFPKKMLEAEPGSDSNRPAPPEQTETEQPAQKEAKEQINQQIEEQVEEETKSQENKEEREQIGEDTVEQKQVSAEQSPDSTETDEGVTNSEPETPTEAKDQEITEQEGRDQETDTERVAPEEKTNLEAEEHPVSVDEVEPTEEESTDEEIKDVDESTAEREPTHLAETNESDEQPISETVQEISSSTTVIPTENTVQV